MKFRPIIFAVLVPAFMASCSRPEKPGANSAGEAKPTVTLVERGGNSLDVLVDGKMFTSYRWPDSVYKPILYPIVSAGGNTVTRGFPINPREGESRDHRHQVGNWLNYGNVNGFDFWGNGHTGKPSPNGGTINHRSVQKRSQGPGEAVLMARAGWIDPSGKELMTEKTEYHFIADDSVRIIDRVTTLTATAKEPINFKDTKEGMFGIRVARPLELPSDADAGAKQDPSSSASTDPRNGNYRSSEGVTGSGVWGTRAKWMDLYGKIGNEKVSLVICDHPGNVGYPTYWHARGYGLFAANPLGAKDFTEGREVMNFTLAPGDSVTFRYRIVVASGAYPTKTQIDAWADAFAKKY